MNYYFLLEDEKSLLKVLPHWLDHLGFKCSRVPDISFVKGNNYVLQSGQGVVQLITKVLFDTIETIIASDNRIDKLVVIVDSESESAASRKKEVENKIFERYDAGSLPFEIVIIVCNHCFESWLLGRAGLYPSYVEEESPFYSYYSHYNIELNDPELMLPPPDSKDNIARYHFHYFHDLMLYKRMKYNKKKPDIVAKPEFFDGLCERIEKTDHISSFKCMIDFIKSEIGNKGL